MVIAWKCMKSFLYFHRIILSNFSLIWWKITKIQYFSVSRKWQIWAHFDLQPHKGAPYWPCSKTVETNRITAKLKFWTTNMVRIMKKWKMWLYGHFSILKVTWQSFPSSWRRGGGYPIVLVYPKTINRYRGVLALIKSMFLILWEVGQMSEFSF